MRSPLLDGWYWQCRGVGDSTATVQPVDWFHVNSMIDNKIDIIKDWHVVVPEYLIVGNQPVDNYRFKPNITMTIASNGMFVINDSADQSV